MSTESTAAAVSTVASALRHRNYRLFFAGQAVSLLGTWMQQVAFGWLVFRLTRDDFLMGLTGFAGQIPAFVLLPFVGVWLDRWDRYRLIRITQALAMTQAFVLAALTLTGAVEFWQVFVLAVLLGCINAVDLPARQVFLPEMVPDRKDLVNAIALNSSLFNGARFAGPMLAGMLIGEAAEGLGEGLCFLVNGGSFLAVLLALNVMDLPPRAENPPAAPLVQEIAEGIRYVLATPSIAVILLLVGWLGLVGLPYMLLLPRIAADHLGAEPKSAMNQRFIRPTLSPLTGEDAGAEPKIYGSLVTAAGLGALLGAVYLSTRRGIQGAGRRIVATCALAGTALAAFSQAREFWLAAALLVLVGFGMMLTLVSCNTIVQTLVPDDKRGRVMSLYNLAFMGLTPFGYLLAGGLSREFGAPATLLSYGGCCLAGAVVFALWFPHREIAALEST